MGVLTHKDIYSSKFITADITDSSHRVFYVPIKFVLGDYFLAKIEGQLYCFRLLGERIFTYRHNLIKSFRKVYYNTEHYNPLSPADMTELENILKENYLPNVDRNMHKTFKILGHKETKDFKEHDLEALIEDLLKHKDEYPQEVNNMKVFLDNLGTKKIVSPVKKISEFIEGDLIATDPKFLGSVVNAVNLVETEHKKVTNTPITGKTPWMKMILIFMMIGMGAGLLYYGYSSGAFNQLIP